MRHLVGGVTPSIVSPAPERVIGGSPAWEHEFEIETWLKANQSLSTPWVALDALPEWSKETCPNLLVTNAVYGSAEDQQQTVRAMLRLREDRLK